ncbi:MAG TPA: hypothetical protein VJ777_05435 [Mycobacterium sp.]|nr:hypothetical protein [Mycobacterium sp.]
MRNLRAAYEDRGWSAGFEYHDMSLHTISYDGDLSCALYYDDTTPHPPVESRDVERRDTYDVIISIVVDRCGVRYQE